MRFLIRHAPAAEEPPVRLTRPDVVAVTAIRVLARGPVIETWINGVPAASLFDAARARGRIGFQVHGVGKDDRPLTVEFRNMRIREWRK